MEELIPEGAEAQILVDYRSLQPETLRSLIEEFVTRDGTDYGASEVTLDQKVAEVLAQLTSGKAVISFNAAAGSVTIVLARDSRA